MRSPDGRHSTVRPSYTPSALTRYKRGKPSQEDGSRSVFLSASHPEQLRGRQALSGQAAKAAQLPERYQPAAGGLTKPSKVWGPAPTGRTLHSTPAGTRRPPQHPDRGRTLASQRAVSGPEPGYRCLHYGAGQALPRHRLSSHPHHKPTSSGVQLHTGLMDRSRVG